MFLKLKECIFFYYLFFSISANLNTENENKQDEISIYLIISGVSFFLFCIVLIISCVSCPPFIKRAKAFTDLESDVHIFGNPRGHKSSNDFRIRVNSNEQKVTFESLPDLSDISGKRVNKSQNWVNWYRPRIVSEKIGIAFEDDKELEKIIKSLGKLNLPRNKLNHIKEIGNGWFGKIILGDIDGNKIVIQSLGGSPTTKHKIVFLKETAAYRQLKHKNLLHVPHYCLDISPMLCILELCHLEDLKSYLRSHVIAIESLENKGMPIRFALDMAHGLKYLHDHNFVHRDFAIRNCLLASDMTLKIGDYGNIEELYQEDYFDLDGVMLPIRWMPPESIEYKNNDITKIDVNKLTNIWSFGVALWELFMFGALPYSDLANEGVLRLVIVDASVKLPPPSIHVRGWMKIYELMNMCWFAAEYRPSLSKLINLLVCLRDEMQRNPTTPTQVDDQFSPFERKWQLMRGGDTSGDLNPTDVFDDPISVINDNFDISSVAFIPATGHHAADFRVDFGDLHNAAGSLLNSQLGVSQMSLITDESIGQQLDFENSLLGSQIAMQGSLLNNLDSTTDSLLGNPGSKEMSIKEESPMHRMHYDEDETQGGEDKNDEMSKRSDVEDDLDVKYNKNCDLKYDINQQYDDKNDEKYGDVEHSQINIQLEYPEIADHQNMFGGYKYDEIGANKEPMNYSKVNYDTNRNSHAKNGDNQYNILNEHEDISDIGGEDGSLNILKNKFFEFYSEIKYDDDRVEDSYTLGGKHAFETKENGCITRGDLIEDLVSKDGTVGTHNLKDSPEARKYAVFNPDAIVDNNNDE